MSKKRTQHQPEFPDDLWNLAAEARLNPPRRFGPYLLHQLVRSSYMSLLFKGTRAANCEPVAVKVCHRYADPIRFHAEIKTTRSRRFNGLIEILKEDVGYARDPRGNHVPYYAMGWVNGPSLGEFLKDPNIGLNDRLKAMMDLCRVVSVLHMNNIAHRDLKPSNVLMEDGITPLLLDLGLAASAELTGMTRTGEHVGGTTGYIPPWSERDPKLIKYHKKQWDVYSLGVILVEALTGERSKGVDDPDFTPDGVEALFADQPWETRRYLSTAQRCLAGHPKQCFADAEAFLDQLKIDQANSTPVTMQPEFPVNKRRAAPNLFLRWTLMIVLLAVLACVFYMEQPQLEPSDVFFQGATTNSVAIVEEVKINESSQRPSEIIEISPTTKMVIKYNTPSKYDMGKVTIDGHEFYAERSFQVGKDSIYQVTKKPGEYIGFWVPKSAETAIAIKYQKSDSTWSRAFLFSGKSYELLPAECLDSTLFSIEQHDEKLVNHSIRCTVRWGKIH